MKRMGERAGCGQRLKATTMFALLPLALVTFALRSGGSEELQLESQAKISITTNLVVLPVSVTDSQGNFVAGLGRENFRVFEDGTPQDVSLFVQEDTPVTVGLIVDHSRSMGNKLPSVSKAVAQFADSSNPADEMFVVDFSDGVSIESLDGQAFTNDHAKLQKALLAVSARGRTALYDAVAKGLRHLELGTREKKALVIVSDGGDNASRLKFADVLLLARQAHAVIYSIALTADNPTEEENPHVLERLCRETGGIAFIAKPDQNISNIAAAIARDLREQYTLGYAPSQNARLSAYRKVVVKVDALHVRGIHVRTRAGYSTAPETQPPEKANRGKP